MDLVFKSKAQGRVGVGPAGHLCSKAVPKHVEPLDLERLGEIRGYESQLLNGKRNGLVAPPTPVLFKHKLDFLGELLGEPRTHPVILNHLGMWRDRQEGAKCKEKRPRLVISSGSTDTLGLVGKTIKISTQPTRLQTKRIRPEATTASMPLPPKDHSANPRHHPHCWHHDQTPDPKSRNLGHCPHPAIRGHNRFKGCEVVVRLELVGDEEKRLPLEGLAIDLYTLLLRVAYHAVVHTALSNASLHGLGLMLGGVDSSLCEGGGMWMCTS
jgi:hypothetical protein